MESNEYPLSDTERAFVAARLRQIELLQAEIRGALGLVADAKGLKGVWSLSQDGIKLISTAPGE